MSHQFLLGRDPSVRFLLWISSDMRLISCKCKASSWAHLESELIRVNDRQDKVAVSEESDRLSR